LKTLSNLKGRKERGRKERSEEEVGWVVAWLRKEETGIDGQQRLDFSAVEKGGAHARVSVKEKAKREREKGGKNRKTDGWLRAWVHERVKQDYLDGFKSKETKEASEAASLGSRGSKTRERERERKRGLREERSDTDPGAKGRRF
jgi:hypothetical protein